MRIAPKHMNRREDCEMAAVQFDLSDLGASLSDDSVLDLKIPIVPLNWDWEMLRDGLNKHERSDELIDCMARRAMAISFADFLASRATETVR